MRFRQHIAHPFACMCNLLDVSMFAIYGLSPFKRPYIAPPFAAFCMAKGRERGSSANPLDGNNA